MLLGGGPSHSPLNERNRLFSTAMPRWYILGLDTSLGRWPMASLSDALVQQLLAGRYIASLATNNQDGSIHMVAVWYWYQGERIYIATSTHTRKTRNLQSNHKVSLMVDSRDPAASYGITIAGTAEMLTGDMSRKWNARVHQKYLS